MGGGLAEVVFLAVLTIIVLPCGFFTLLALLDRFERSLGPDLPAPPQLVVKPAPLPAGAEPQLDDEPAGADIVLLPVAITMAEAPAAATG